MNVQIDEVPKGFKWLLCKNNDTSDSITTVRKETSYYYVENGKKIEVDRDDLLDGFRFGDTIIPISGKDNVYKFFNLSSLKILFWFRFWEECIWL